MEPMTIREIYCSTSAYEQELALRDKILRRPLGLCLYDEKLDHEVDDIHIGAFINGRLVGVLILTKLSHQEYKMRQVAVDDGFQGQGIGTEMVAFSEELIRSRGGKKIELHARKTAVAFYERLGYETIGEEFTEVTIPHRSMFKRL